MNVGPCSLLNVSVPQADSHGLKLRLLVPFMPIPRLSTNGRKLVIGSAIQYTSGLRLADAPPDMRAVHNETKFRPKKFRHSLGSLSQHLVRMPIGERHHLSNSEDVVVRYIFVKEIAHRIDEDHPGGAPFQWFFEFLGNE